MVDVAAHTSRTLVGRDAELTEIASSLGVDPSGAGTPDPVGVVLLSGDAGVGKTLTFYIFGVLPDFKATFVELVEE